MLIEILMFILLASIPAAFSYLLDYALGHPMAEQVQLKEIFSSYSIWLAKMALPERKKRDIVASLSPLLNDDDPEIRRHGKDQLNLSYLAAGKEYFYIEKALGMCPFCTNFWIAQIAAIIFFFSVPTFFINPIFFFLLIPIFSHAILRKL